MWTWVVLALSATILTSFLPICNKRLLQSVSPAFVAWAVNAASLPILALGTLLITECSVHGFPPIALTCTLTMPRVDLIFVAALLGSTALNWAATLLSTYALKQADASLVTPLLTFNPAFTVLLAWAALGETPDSSRALGSRSFCSVRICWKYRKRRPVCSRPYVYFFGSLEPSSRLLPADCGA